MHLIRSKENETIKEIKRLKEAKYRNLTDSYVVEGIKMIKEAFQEEAIVKKVVICEELLNKNSENLREKLGIDEKLLYDMELAELVYVDSKIFKHISNVENPQGILAIIGKKNENIIHYDQDIIVALDGIQDPGNLGTILRTLDSCNLTQIILSKECADPYNPKVVRSTMGAVYRINIVQTDNLANTLMEAKENGFKILCTDLSGKKNIYEVEDYNKKIIVIGNEANGVSEEILNIADEKVIIPMLGKTESLNVAVATGVILYEYVRRKVKGCNK